MSAQPQADAACRAMTLHELDAVVAIEVRAYEFPWTRGNFIDSLAAGYLAECLVGPTGSTIGYFVAMPGVDELHLLNITIDPAQQGRGHGGRLLGEVARRARALRLAAIWLEVRASNERARQLYRRHAYVEIGLRRGYYPATVRREDAVVMKLALPPAEGAA
ncbi:MAG: ribosomal protein S18-alanine N-acetyltransferase [Burkholderiales bacterium]|nr:ribosomal protein S18-alanine N-acetyltransferase [Burkholderiales bacterium]MDE2157667.1 ribosomal protein S18-alanine N-acetyltransferase [Burkholderiales bacterium]